MRSDVDQIVFVRARWVGSLAFVALLAVGPFAGRATAETAQTAGRSADGGALAGSQAQDAQVDNGWGQVAGASFKALGGLGVVLCLILFGAHAVRRYGPRLLGKAAQKRSMKLVETLAMGEKRSIALVELGDQRFLLGNTTSSITLLAALRPALVAGADEFELADTKPSGQVAELAPFRAVFDRERNQNGNSAKSIPPDLRAKMRELRANLGR